MPFFHFLFHSLTHSLANPHPVAVRFSEVVGNCVKFAYYFQIADEEVQSGNHRAFTPTLYLSLSDAN